MRNDTGFWEVAGASWRGTSHKKTATPCQDAFAWERLDDERVVLAVADGAGSAPLSDLGSKLAVHAAIGAIRTSFAARSAGGEYADDETGWRVRLSQAASSARDEIFEAARRLGHPPRDLASTLIVTVVTPALTAAIQVGDGAAVVETLQGDVRALTRPDSGEYMGEATFLVSRQAVERAQVMIAPGSQAVALFSDGLQMLALLYPSWEPFVPFFRATFDFFREHRDGEVATKIEAFLSSERLLARTDDDVTLLLARCTRVPATASSPVVPSTTEGKTTVVEGPAVANPQEVIT